MLRRVDSQLESTDVGGMDVCAGGKTEAGTGERSAKTVSRVPHNLLPPHPLRRSFQQILPQFHMVNKRKSRRMLLYHLADQGFCVEIVFTF